MPDIEFACGHTAYAQIRGFNSRDKASRRAWLEGQVCPDCWQGEKRAAADAAAERVEAALPDLPALTGTEKQIAWARTIRAQWVQEAEGLYEQMENRLEAHPELQEQYDRTTALMEAILHEPAARWWIDHRTDGVRYTLTERLRETDPAEIARRAQAEKERLAAEQAARAAAEAARQAVEQARRDAAKAEADAAAAKQARLWEKKVELAQEVKAVWPGCWQLTVWQRSGEKRVYLDQGGERGDPKITYWVTGNAQHKPGSLTMEHLPAPKPERAAVLALCQRAADQWNSLRLDVDAALRED